jgi:hypothetical protein
MGGSNEEFRYLYHFRLFMSMNAVGDQPSESLAQLQSKLCKVTICVLRTTGKGIFTPEPLSSRSKVLAHAVKNHNLHILADLSPIPNKPLPVRSRRCSLTRSMKENSRVVAIPFPGGDSLQISRAELSVESSSTQCFVL